MFMWACKYHFKVDLKKKNMNFFFLVNRVGESCTNILTSWDACKAEMSCGVFVLVLTYLGLLSSLHTAGNRPEASRHLRRPSETAKAQPQPSSANRVRAPLFLVM